MASPVRNVARLQCLLLTFTDVRRVQFFPPAAYLVNSNVRLTGRMQGSQVITLPMIYWRTFSLVTRLYVSSATIFQMSFFRPLIFSNNFRHFVYNTGYPYQVLGQLLSLDQLATV